MDTAQPSIDWTSAEPAHVQIADYLAERIEAGEFKVGERIPDRASLEATFGVSHTTATDALRLLKNGGLVVNRPGRGTFVFGPDAQVRAARPASRSLAG